MVMDKVPRPLAESMRVLRGVYSMLEPMGVKTSDRVQINARKTLAGLRNGVVKDFNQWWYQTRLIGRVRAYAWTLKVKE